MRAYLLASHDFTFTEINTGLSYFGPDGVVGTNPAALPIFDLTEYDEVMATLNVQGATGTSPRIRLIANMLDQATSHPGLGNEIESAALNLNSDNGSGALVLGSNKGSGFTNTGIAFVNSNPLAMSPHRFPFAQFGVYVGSGTLTGLTVARARIFGWK